MMPSFLRGYGRIGQAGVFTHIEGTYISTFDLEYRLRGQTRFFRAHVCGNFSRHACPIRIGQPDPDAQDKPDKPRRDFEKQ